LRKPADTQVVTSKIPAESEVRFLEYRLEVISGWPNSARRDAVRESILLRLMSLARSTTPAPETAEILASSYRLLDGACSMQQIEVP
jgi:hypothetical protein